jgi:hypothetical protein
MALDMVPVPVQPQVQAEIDRYTENGLLERGSLRLGTTPAISIIVDRFESETGADADFPEREPTCEEVVLPGAALVEVVAKRCNAPGANTLHVFAHRGDLIITVETEDVPEAVPIEPVVATLGEIFRAIDPLLTR